MRRILLAAVLLTLSGVTACSTDGPTRAVAPGESLGRPRLAIAASNTDGRIAELSAALFPKGLETAAGTRWNNVKSKYDAGQKSVALSMLAELLKWIDQKAAGITALSPALCTTFPTGPSTSSTRCETPASAAAKLKLLMTAYVNGVTVPDLPSGLDFGGAVVLPGTNPDPIISRDELAGIDIPQNGVSATTVVTILEDPPTTPYGTCGGPLQTTLCQIPRYYKFDAQPHVKLNSPAKFAVCQTEPSALPWSTPDTPTLQHLDARLRLAHDKPASSADYSPNATIYQGVEILPLTSQTFLDCHAHLTAAGPTNALLQKSYALLTAAWSLVAPKTAWAIDLGGGGEGVSFSNFNNLDPTLAVSFTNIVMSACNSITFGYTLDGVDHDVYNKPAGCTTASAPQSFADVTVNVPVGSVATLKGYLRDNSCNAKYDDTSNHAQVTGTSVAITDAGGGCTEQTTARPPAQLQSGAYFGNLNYTRSTTQVLPAPSVIQ